MKYLSIFIALISLMINTSSAQSSKVSSAITYLDNNELDRAKEAIDMAAVNEKTMNESKTWYYRGRIYNAIALDQTGKYSKLVVSPLDSALASFKKALSFEDVKSIKKQIMVELQYVQMGYFNQGANSYSAKDYQSAYTSFAKSAEANSIQRDIDAAMPMDTGVVFNVGLTAEKTGKIDEAITTYQRLVDMKYNEPYIYQALAEMYGQKKMDANELAVINSGRKLFPADKNILIAELNYYLSRGKASEIVDKLNQAIALDPNNAELYFALGNSYGELMKLDSLSATQYMSGAISAYENAIKLNPSSFEANLNLGALYYNSAIELNKKMIDLPLDAEAEYKKLEAQRNQLYKQALPYFEKAHEIKADDIPTMQALKEIYAKTADYDKMNAIKKLLGE